MKIELIKEVGILGEEIYLIELNGSYVAGTTTRDKTKAIAFFESTKQSNGKIIKQVIKSETI